MKEQPVFLDLKPKRNGRTNKLSRTGRQVPDHGDHQGASELVLMPANVNRAIQNAARICWAAPGADDTFQTGQGRVGIRAPVIIGATIAGPGLAPRTAWPARSTTSLPLARRSSLSRFDHRDGHHGR